MRALGAQEIRGTWGTVLLPIRDDDSIDYPALQREVQALIAAGVDGVYTNGTAGEFHTQSDDEFLEVSTLVAHECEAAGRPFQLGVSHSSAQASLARVRQSRHLHPSAFQVILPDWVTVTDEEAVTFLRRMAEEAEGVGLVLYNPPHAKRVLSPDTLARLCGEVTGLVGLKVADGPPSWYGLMRTLPLSIFVPGHHLATGLLAGAHGSYSNVACLSPAGAVAWSASVITDPLAALALERRIVDFFQTHVTPFARQGYCNAALDKLLATSGGWSEIGTRLRWPYRWIEPAHAVTLGRLAREALPELMSAAT